MKSLEEMAVEHPYYCSRTNYFSNEARRDWETMTEFLDEFESLDIDLNLMFRWDICNRSDDDEGVKAGRYYAEVFMINQRKGIFLPHRIAHVNETEVERFQAYASKHWLRLKEMWDPISYLETPNQSTKEE